MTTPVRRLKHARKTGTLPRLTLCEKRKRTRRPPALHTPAAPALHTPAAYAQNLRLTFCAHSAILDYAETSVRLFQRIHYTPARRAKRGRKGEVIDMKSRKLNTAAQTATQAAQDAQTAAAVAIVKAHKTQAAADRAAAKANAQTAQRRPPLRTQSARARSTN